jgi:hypothetical protein
MQLPAEPGLILSLVAIPTNLKVSPPTYFCGINIVCNFQHFEHTRSESVWGCSMNPD